LTSNRAVAQPSEIAVFDFLSGDHVHLPFNEGYLRVLRAAYPDDRICFHGGMGHVERLMPRVGDVGNIAFEPCKPFETRFGVSHHNPLAGRWAARQCLRSIGGKSAGRALRLIALLGFNASLFSVVGHGWPSTSSVPLHMILHSQLGEAMVWRSRNPLIRAADLISQLATPLPPSVRIVALELGIKEAIGDASPSISRSVLTLEHPILRSEWAENPPFADVGAENPPFAGVGKVKIGFVGHARQGKGFDVFVDLADHCLRDEVEFHAIGHSSSETDHLDTGKLSRKPSKKPLRRDEYLAALQDVDIVCLPLHSRSYDFTGSGTVSDAIAALKPLIVIRNRTIEAVFDHYGPIGWIADGKADLFEMVRTLDATEFGRERPGWIANLRAIREARRPEAVAQSYAGSIG